MLLNTHTVHTVKEGEVLKSVSWDSFILCQEDCECWHFIFFRKQKICRVLVWLCFSRVSQTGRLGVTGLLHSFSLILALTSHCLSCLLQTALNCTDTGKQLWQEFHDTNLVLYLKKRKRKTKSSWNPVQVWTRRTRTTAGDEPGSVMTLSDLDRNMQHPPTHLPIHPQIVMLGLECMMLCLFSESENLWTKIITCLIGKPHV